MRVVFLHGLESSVDPVSLVPTGRKARFLAEAFDTVLVPLDTRRAVSVKDTLGLNAMVWPYDGYEQAFETPVAKAREAMLTEPDVVVASSFGGAVALRLMHESPELSRPTVLLAGAGPKLTPYRTLPAGVPALLVHGRHDTVVPLADSEMLATTSDMADLMVLDDDHRLASVVCEAKLGAWVRRMVPPHKA
ncbi:MAG: hypothetical protein ACON4N_12295 [Myxococcota bacterium]